MHSHELLPHPSGNRVKALGTTRAALITGALQGMYAMSEPILAENAQLAERPFKLEAPGFPALLVDVLNDARAKSNEAKEAYTDVRFTLITDTKAEGAFIGKPVIEFKNPVKAATYQHLVVEKNAEGKWEAVVTFEP